jgi:diguanylate cyclase (GGDEF)-like protein
MKIPKKTLLAIGIALTSLIGVLYAASSTILMNSIKQAEEKDVHRVVEGVLSALAQTGDNLNVNLDDWASWDDTYIFAQNANQNYIKSNLSSGALSNLKLNLVLYVQPSGKITYGTGFDYIHQQKKPIPAAIKAHISPQSLLLRHTSEDSSLQGIVLLPEGPMLIVSQPILTSDDKGPNHGTLIFGRQFDANAIANLSRIASLPITVHTLNTAIPPDFQAVRDELLAGQKIVVRSLSDRTIAGYSLLPDIYGKPALILRVDVPREIYQQGQNSLRYLITSLTLVGLVFGGVILLLLQRLVQQERKWQQSEEYRHLVAQASESIFLVDADTKRILETNAAFENLLGFSSAEVGRLTLYDVIADERENIDRSLLMLTENHHITAEQQYRRQDGLIVDVEVNANPISYDGRNVFCIIVHDITKRKQIEKQLLHEAFHDSLTGLANRALFMDRLEHAIQQSKRHADYFFAILFLDLDRFKVINDSLGHMVGDRLLVAIAQRISHRLRSSDTFARLGGDEFAIILENCTDINEIIERIQQELKLPFNLNGQEIFASASIGAIANTTSYERPEDLLRDADTAMYKAKAGGKARHAVFDIAMHDQVVALLQLETDLRRAVENCEFQLYYQPIVSLSNNKIIGFEALIRWQHPHRGLIYPAEFIPIAEETGLIIPLGKWVLREACRQMRVWQQQFPMNPPLTISVNFSVKQFAQTDVVEQITQILQQTNFDARSLKLELTESVLMESPESVAVVMQQLKALGVSLSLDDFGTGYSSLSYLHRFPIDCLKIDRSFISNIGNCYDWEIVRAIVMLSIALEIDAIAEGVETEEQLAKLRILDCKYAQGYFFSQPLDGVAAGASIWELAAVSQTAPPSTHCYENLSSSSASTASYRQINTFEPLRVFKI